MIMPIILFGVGVMMLLLAYLIGVRKMYDLFSGINTATAEQKAKMDLPAICRATGTGFAVIGMAFLIAGGLLSAGVDWAPEAAFAVLFVTVWIMIVYVQRFDGNNFNEAGCPNKRYYLAVFGISALLIVVLVLETGLVAATINSPKISFAEEIMEIKGMYGTNIAKSEITGIVLIDQPVSFSLKTNGSAVFGAYKGNFISKQYGPVLVYVKESSLPWICILRSGGKTVLISQQSSVETKKLYDELRNWINS